MLHRQSFFVFYCKYTNFLAIISNYFKKKVENLTFGVSGKIFYLCEWLTKFPTR